MRQQKRHRCIEQSSGLCGRGRGWDDLGEWHWNMYNIICEKNCQSRFDAWYRVLGDGALGWPRGIVWGGRWEGGSGWETHVHPGGFMLMYGKPIQYCKVISLQLNKFVLKKRTKKEKSLLWWNMHNIRLIISPFKMCNSALLNIFTMLHNYHPIHFQKFS